MRLEVRYKNSGTQLKLCIGAHQTQVTSSHVKTESHRRDFQTLLYFLHPFPIHLRTRWRVILNLRRPWRLGGVSTVWSRNTLWGSCTRYDDFDKLRFVTVVLPESKVNNLMFTDDFTSKDKRVNDTTYVNILWGTREIDTPSWLSS